MYTNAAILPELPNVHQFLTFFYQQIKRYIYIEVTHRNSNACLNYVVIYH